MPVTAISISIVNLWLIGKFGYWKSLFPFFVLFFPRKVVGKWRQVVWIKRIYGRTMRMSLVFAKYGLADELLSFAVLLKLITERYLLWNGIYTVTPGIVMGEKSNWCSNFEIFVQLKLERNSCNNVRLIGNEICFLLLQLVNIKFFYGTLSIE